jgi:hypothetical protein
MTYEGWANYQTWNVALTIKNWEPLLTMATMYAKTHPSPTYEQFIGAIMPSNYGDITADGVSWTDPTLDNEALDAMFVDMGEQ